jgi:hypothetical protein
MAERWEDSWCLRSIEVRLHLAPNITLGISGVRPADTGLAAGLINVALQMGAAIGVAALTTLLRSPDGGAVSGLSRDVLAVGAPSSGTQDQSLGVEEEAS